MKIYRFLTGKDDAEFCHKVTRALSEGWELYGEHKYVGNQFFGMNCGQAVTKEVADQPYEKGKKLTDYE